MVFSAAQKAKYVALVGGMSVAFGFAGSLPAAAKTYYKYWSYWHKPPGATSWQYSQVGASGYYLKQGDQVEGWRFAVGTAGPSDPQPRPMTASYADYCKDQNSGKAYRVLLVVDYGTESGAPSGPVYSCYGYDSSVNGFTVLTQQHTERDSNGLICAIDTYPHSGCGDTVSSPAPKASATPRRTTTTTSTSAAPAQSQPTAVSPVASTHSSAPASSSSTVRPRPAATLSSSAAATTSVTGSSDPQQTSARPFSGATTGSHSAGFPVGLVVGVIAAAGFGVAAWWRLRRSP